MIVFLTEAGAFVPFPILVILAFTVVISGFGALCWTGRRSPSSNFGAQAMAGFMMLTATALALNILMPIGPSLSIGIMALGAALFIVQRRAIFLSLGARPLAMLMIMAVLAVVLGIDSVGAPISRDSALYHLQAIQWIEHSNGVLGLANIHPRFGYNSSFFGASALLDWPETGRKALFTLTYGILFIATLSIIQPVLNRPMAETMTRPSGLYAACLAAYLIPNSRGMAFRDITSSPAYDPPTAIFVCYAFWAFLVWYEASSEKHAGQARDALCGVITSTVLAATVKLSAAPLVLLPIIVLGRQLRQSPADFRLSLLDPVTIVAGGTVLGWLITSLMHSGCLVFPARLTCIAALPWSVPLDSVQQASEDVAAWARAPGPEYMASLHGVAWLHDWALRQLSNGMVTRSIAALMAGVILLLPVILVRRYREPGIGDGTSLLAPFIIAMTVALLGLAFWFATAPDPRFAQGFLIATPCLFAAAVLGRWPGYKFLSKVLRLVPLGIGLLFFVQTIFFLPASWQTARNTQIWPAIEQPETVEMSIGTPSNLKLRVPKDEGNELCWDAPRPCVPRYEWSAGVHEGRMAIWRMFSAGEPTNP